MLLSVRTMLQYDLVPTVIGSQSKNMKRIATAWLQTVAEASLAQRYSIVLTTMVPSLAMRVQLQKCWIERTGRSENHGRQGRRRSRSRGKDVRHRSRSQDHAKNRWSGDTRHRSWSDRAQSSRRRSRSRLHRSRRSRSRSSREHR